MKKNEVSQTAWLVKNHLVMSDIAQKIYMTKDNCRFC